MGVHGLWKLIEPSGKVVPLDTLEGKVLAVDISIWLHQAIKGYQDSKGAPMPNAHLLTIYNRVCKLLYFRIKPVFVFDGGVPTLKKETIAKRNQLKSKNQSDALKIQKQLINTLLKHSAVTKVLSEKTRAELGTQARKVISSKKDTDDDLFMLPPSQTTYESSDSESYDETSTSASDSSPTKYFNIHDVDEKSKQFRNLPADVRHEILTDLKETRKQNSWGRIHELPKQSDDFATYQMKRLLKRYSIQTCLEEAEKEMGGATLSLNELESLLNDHGVITEDKGKRIASDENTRYLYIKDMKKTLENTKEKEMKQREMAEEEFQNDLETAVVLSTVTEDNEAEIATTSTATSAKTTSQSEDSELEGDLQAAIQLSLQNDTKIEAETSNNARDTVFNHEKEFQSDLKAAILLSLQETPSTSVEASQEASQEVISSSDDINSSDTTPMSSQDILNPDAELSTYLRTLNDSDFNSSDDEGKLEDESLEKAHGQKAADKIFSAARNYMMEYGGLTQAGVEEIFGNKDDANKVKSKVKGQSVRFKTNLYTDDGSTTTTENDKKEVKEVVVESLISDSDSSSEGDFVDVSSEASEDEKTSTKTCKTPKLVEDDVQGLQIEFNSKEELVDDIFSDIFDSTPVKTGIKVKETSSAAQKTDLNISADVELAAEDVETQKAIEESIKLTQDSHKDKLSLPEPEPEPETETEPSTSVLMQELMSQKPSSSTRSQDENLAVTVDDLVQLKSTLSEASLGLMMDRGAKERLAGNISDQMYQEAQDLLTLFGIPYIIAPMEAEAQCAFLNEINLTDGTITDDSDIWLFGGKTVYKNFFNHDKQVLEFRSESIQHHFKLNRHQLISLAMLVGSDYTTGIQGIGPVTALEVLAAFPPKSNYEVITSLEKFRDWFKTGKRVYGRGKAFLRNKLKNIELHDGFPSSSVLKAYLEPTVETSKDTFTWGKPRVESLKHYTREKFGWNAKKVTDTLDPVLKRLTDNTAQKRIQDYFKTVYKAPMNTSMEIQQKLSKRVQKALGTIAGKVDNEGVASSSSNDELEEVLNGDKVADPEELEALQVLKKTQKLSKEKNKVIRKEVETQLKKIDKKSTGSKVNDELEVKKPRLVNLHRKEVIPQREFAKTSQLQNKLKAIEVFRKSTKGPGFVKKRLKVARKPKDDAALSESSDSN